MVAATLNGHPTNELTPGIGIFCAWHHGDVAKPVCCVSMLIGGKSARAEQVAKFKALGLVHGAFLMKRPAQGYGGALKKLCPKTHESAASRANHGYAYRAPSGGWPFC